MLYDTLDYRLDVPGINNASFGYSISSPLGEICVPNDRGMWSPVSIYSRGDKVLYGDKWYLLTHAEAPYSDDLPPDLSCAWEEITSGTVYLHLKESQYRDDRGINLRVSDNCLGFTREIRVRPVL